MTVPDTVRVYVNEKGVSVPHTATVLDAVREIDPAQASAIVAGTMRVTDSRGLPTSETAQVNGGAIFRVLPVRESIAKSDAAS